MLLDALGRPVGRGDATKRAGSGLGARVPRRPNAMLRERWAAKPRAKGLQYSTLKRLTEGKGTKVSPSLV